METKIYEVKGTYKMKSQDHEFSKIINAHSEGFAKEKTFSQMGSAHKINRSKVTIKSISIHKPTKKKGLDG